MVFTLLQAAEFANRLRCRDEGQGLVEYGLILGLIAVICIAALTTMGGAVNALLGTINAALGG